MLQHHSLKRKQMMDELRDHSYTRDVVPKLSSSKEDSFTGLILTHSKV